MPTYTPINTILTWFQTGDFPTEAQFSASWTSFWHKGEQIPIEQIDGLTNFIQQITPIDTFNSHLTDANAHNAYLAKKDASNLSSDNVISWKAKLGVSDLPPNLLLYDYNGQNGNGYNKSQCNSLFMALADFVNSDGKITAGKIEALGLTELIPATQTSLSGFISNYQSYTYEKNDIIAIPDASGNYSLYIFKGGGKTVSSNYLPTGLTNITISMVQGLQAALDAKLDKPTMTAGYVGRWSGTNFVNGVIYDNGTNVSIGSSNPTPASIFDVQGTGRVSLPAPRMTQAQRQVITLSSVAAGGLVYQTDGLAGYYLWDGTSWKTLGSNISNADLTNTSARTFTQNAAFTWDTLGNPYYWKGLIDKSADLTNFNRVLGINQTTKEIGVIPAVQVNLPETTNVSGIGLGNQSITVNHIYPNPIPDPAQIPTGIQNLMGNFKNLQFTKFIASDWTINNINDGANTPISVFQNGRVELLNDSTNKGRSSVYTNAYSKIFPYNKQWAIKLYINPYYNHYGTMAIGLTQNSDNTQLALGYIVSNLMNGVFGNHNYLSDQPDLGTIMSSLYFVITHANDVIYLALCNEQGDVRTKVIGNFDANGNYRVLASLNTVKNGQYQHLMVAGEYWIEP